jgi:NADPH-dependent ferric siderophore reductase
MSTPEITAADPVARPPLRRPRFVPVEVRAVHRVSPRMVSVALGGLSEFQTAPAQHQNHPDHDYGDDDVR